MLKRAGNQDKMLQGLLSAVQFLTIIPCPKRYAFNARSALPYFPICGLAIGVVVVAVDALASMFWARPVVALLDIIALAAISGALHLDGLADTADGLYGHNKPEQALAIMKDSCIGAMGMVAVLCCLALKWVAIASMTATPYVNLFIIPAYARTTVLFGTKLLPYGRPDSGTGHAFFNTTLVLKDFWSLGVLVLISFFTDSHFIALNVCFVAVVFSVIGWYRRKVQCITGDMLGAMIEITETGLFLVAAAHWGI